MRNILIIGLCAAALLRAAPAGAEETRPWLLALYGNYGSFRSSELNVDGAQAISYMQLVYDNKKYGVGLTTSYSSTQYDTVVSGQRFSLSAFNDTAITTYYNAIYDRLNIRFGVDAGLPTGVGALSLNQLSRVITDDVKNDLLLLNTYGEGFNVAGHVAIAYNAGVVTWGLGGRYLYSGPYDSVSDFDADEFDPGDSLSAVASALVKAGEKNLLLVTLTYTTFTADTLDGREVLENGDIYSIEGRFIASWTGNARSIFVAAYRSQQENKRLQGNGDFTSDTGNANQNIIEAYVANSYRFNGWLTLTGLLGYKTAEANDFEEGDFLQDAGRSKLYVEPGLIWRFSDVAYASARVRYARVKDKKDAYSPVDADYDVIQIDAGVVHTF